MPSRQEALAALGALSSIPKTELPATPVPPTRSGMVGEAGAVLRVRDRMRAAEASKPAPVKATPQDADAAAWAAWEEEWRKKNGGHYVNR